MTLPSASFDTTQRVTYRIERNRQDRCCYAED